jgi:hypothetical protein
MADLLYPFRKGDYMCLQKPKFNWGIKIREEGNPGGKHKK